MPRAWKSSIQVALSCEACGVALFMSGPLPPNPSWENKEGQGFQYPPRLPVPFTPDNHPGTGEAVIAPPQGKLLMHLLLIGHLPFKGGLTQMLRFPVYSSTISYPLPAWEGTEGVTYSPWAQGLTI